MTVDAHTCVCQKLFILHNLKSNAEVPTTSAWGALGGNVKTALYTFYCQNCTVYFLLSKLHIMHCITHFLQLSNVQSAYFHHLSDPRDDRFVQLSLLAFAFVQYPRKAAVMFLTLFYLQSCISFTFIRSPCNPTE